jgi:hypothetical protein
MAERLGLRSYHERCLTCPEAEQCGFFLDLASSPGLADLYLQHEHHDGYVRDRCVFRPDIDIEDSMEVMVKYDTSVILSYSLNAFCAWEGYTIAFNGTKGRLEHSLVEQSYVSGVNAVQGGVHDEGAVIRVIPLRGTAKSIEPWRASGSHGGGDAAMLRDIFHPHPSPDKYLRAADERSGAASILVGIAANRCLETGQPVFLADLVSGLAAPDYPAMPSRSGPVSVSRTTG